MGDEFVDSLAPNCLADEKLVQLLSRGDEAVPSEIERHLSLCARCQARLESLAGLAELPSALPLPLDQGSLEPLSQLLATLSAPPNEPVGPPRMGESLELSPSSVPGALGEFAGYTLLERVAEGGMGIVYRAHDPQLARMVAIKVLRPSMVGSEQSRLRFVREARAAAAVVHEHVVAIHAVGEHRGLPFLVMSFIGGQSLEKRIASSQLSLIELLRVGAQTARGLAAAHAQGLIHRDVKLGNILLENSVERVKLVDFGLARAIEDTSLTQLGVVAGTPEYMAPEQVKGEAISAGVDQFGLGCVLYTAASGISPFRCDTTMATLRRILETEPKPLHELLPDKCPPWFGNLVQRLMAKATEDRLASMSEVADLLEACLRDVKAGRIPEDQRLLPGLGVAQRGRRLRVASIIAGLALLLSVGCVYWWGSSRVSEKANSPGSADLSTTQPLFRIDRGRGSAPMVFSNLINAAAAAIAGDTIELPFSGEYTTGGVRLGKKSLRLRAPPGSHPILTLAAGERAMIFAEADLLLEGLELRAPGNGSDKVLPGDIPVTGLRGRPGAARGEKLDVLVYVEGGRLTVRSCRLVAPTPPSSFSTLVAMENCPEGIFEHSEFFNLGGVAVSWRRRDSAGTVPLASEPPAASMVFSNSLVVGRDGVLVGANTGLRCTWTLQRSAFLCLGLYRVLNSGDHLLSIRNSILALRQALSFDVLRTGGMREVPLEVTNLVLVASPQFADTDQLRAKDPGLIGPFPYDELVRRVRTRASLGIKRKATDYQTVIADFPGITGSDWEKLPQRTPLWHLIGPGTGWRLVCDASLTNSAPIVR